MYVSKYCLIHAYFLNDHMFVMWSSEMEKKKKKKKKTTRHQVW